MQTAANTRTLNPMSIAAMRSLMLSVRPVVIALAGASFGWLLTMALNRFDPLVVLIGSIAVLGGLMVVLWPITAMPLAIAVLYSNLQVVAGTSLVFVAAIAATWLGLLVFPLVHALMLRRTRPRVDAVFVMMLAFLTAKLISSLIAKDLSLALASVFQYMLEGLALYWLVVNVLRSWRTLHGAIWSLVLTCAFLASLTVYQTVTHSYQQQFGGLAGRQLRYEQEELDQIKASGGRKKVFRLADRAAGPVGDPNRYAQILLVSAPFAVYLVIGARTKGARLVAAASAVLVCAGVLLTYSRGAFLAFALVVSLLVVWKTIKLSHVITASMILAVAVLLFAPNFVSRIASIGTSAALVDDEDGPQPDAAIRGRATEMLASLSVFLDHPIIGVGPGQYRPFYSEQYQLSPDIAYRYLPREREPHNLLLGIAAELGVVGLTIFLSVLALLITGLWRARKYWQWRDPERAALATATLLSVVAYVGTGLFLHLAFERYFWFLVSLASASRHLLVRDAWITERIRRSA